MWQAIDLLRALPVGGRVAGRWDADKEAYTSYVEHLRDSGLPQPRRDSAVAAAHRLNWLERGQASCALTSPSAPRTRYSCRPGPSSPPLPARPRGPPSSMLTEARCSSNLPAAWAAL